MSDSYAYDRGLPCLNPYCKSHGKPHANCHCYDGGEQVSAPGHAYKGPGEQFSTVGHEYEYAEGGQVQYCSKGMPHKEDCEYYQAGGDVPQEPVDHPSTTLGHAANHHGLLGMFKNVGHAALAKSDKHTQVLEDAQEHYKLKQDTPDAKPRTFGHKLGEHLSTQNHEKAAELIQNHPMIGNVSQSKLTPMLKTLAQPLLLNDPNPEALRSSVDYLNSAAKGKSNSLSHISNLFNPKSSKHEPDEHKIEALKKQLDLIQENPELLVENPSTLGHYLPEHAAEHAAMMARASTYFQSLKPLKQQEAPFDEIPPVDKTAEAQYNRQLGIAEDPMLVLKHTKEGTLQPQDLTTVQTLYPGLAKFMVDEAGDALIDAKTKGKDLPYHQRQSISLLLGAPLDSTMTSTSIQAIMTANTPKQPQKPQGGGKSNKTTEYAVKESDKVNKMYSTPLQARQLSKKD